MIFSKARKSVGSVQEPTWIWISISQPFLLSLSMSEASRVHPELKLHRGQALLGPDAVDGQ
jgi:hypothetical protein